MKVDLQTWITFEILLSNWIFLSLRVMHTPLKVLKLIFFYVTRISTVVHSESIEIITRKYQQTNKEEEEEEEEY